MDLWIFLLLTFVISILPFQRIIPWGFTQFQLVASQLESHQDRVSMSTAPYAFFLVRISGYFKMLFLLQYAAEWYSESVWMIVIVMVLFGHCRSPLNGFLLYRTLFFPIFAVMMWISPLIGITWLLSTGVFILLANHRVVGMALGILSQLFFIWFFALEPISGIIVLLVLGVVLFVNVRDIFRLLEGEKQSLLRDFKMRH